MTNGGHEALNPLHPSVEARLDPVFAKLYTEQAANTPNGPIDLPKLRKNYSKLYSYGTAPAPEVADVKDVKIPSFDGEEITLRVYRPDNASQDTPLPVHMDFHGGGWGLGDLETESHILKHIVHQAKVVVIDVDYRLVPEYPFPTGLRDCFAALQHVHSHADAFGVDPQSISVGGVSAGGHISLAVSHLARDAGIPLVLCAVGTPQIDDISGYEQAADSPFSSMREMEFAPTLNWARLKWFDTLKWDSLSTDPETRKKQLQDVGWFKNLLTAPNFANLPRTLVYTAECDPMRDEGEAYAEKLRQAGNDVDLKRYPGVPHPFMHMDNALWQAKDFIDRTAKEIAKAHKTI
ncbi:hypothetical protein TRICI_005433 [Trichomonascus ciferrii]|uniref:Alpha/beta hydrolase fold-3 domain-containing protein n=1 Tax=Trichomonascus ciferrii TaxID=44093 RepID=A0A642USL4_9ASCO|nr:hypothetical protein TRICI_005433 [Trichomonascus ciferrii]